MKKVISFLLSVVMLTSMITSVNISALAVEDAVNIDLTGVPVDITFVVDKTGSMSDEISNVRKNLSAFSEALLDKNIDVNFALIDYANSKYTIHNFNDMEWTNSVSELETQMSNIYTSGNDEIPTQTLQYIASDNWKWRETSEKFVFLLTDESEGYFASQESSLIESLNRKDIHTSVVTTNSLKSVYENLFEKTGGVFFNISSSDYANLMRAYAENVAESSVYTTTGYVYPSEYTPTNDLRDVSNSSLEIWIPGIKKTAATEFYSGNYSNCESMVAQGVCFAGNNNEYMLVSAYCANGLECKINGKDKVIYEHNSVIYVLSNSDPSNRKLITTISLPNSTHCGGIAYDGYRIWIASTSCMKYINYSDIATIIDSGKKYGKVNHYNGSLKTSEKSSEYSKYQHNSSFVTFYDNLLVVGSFDKDDNGMLCGYDIFSDVKNIEKKPQFSMTLPNCTQGAEFVDYNGSTYLILSISAGRSKLSKIRVYKPSINSNTNLSGFIKKNNAIHVYNYPCMTEDLTALCGFLYTNYESASDKYYGNPGNYIENGKEKAKSPTDRVTASSIKDLINGTCPLNSSTFDILASGYCGNNVQWVLYDNGSLNISGFGDVYDYNESPFLEYAPQIKKIYVGRGITRIGNYAFNSLNSLKEVNIMVGLYGTTIGKNVFCCEELNKVNIEGEGQSAVVLEDSSINQCTGLSNMNMTGCTSLFVPEEFDLSASVIFSTDNDQIAQAAENYSVTVHTHNMLKTETVSANCNVEGYDVYSCSDCDYSYEIVTAASTGEHTFNDGVCEICGETESTFTNHIFTTYIFNNDATCTDDGTETAYCDDCSEVFDTRVSSGTAHHIWNEGDITLEPTCVETGIKKYTCTVCGVEENETVAATGIHSWDDGEIILKPTCNEEGMMEYTCNICGENKTEVMEKTTVHSWDSGTIISEPTCAATGSKKYVCTVCATIKTESIAKLPHQYETTTVQPTCVDKGYTTYTCNNCGYSYNSDYKNAFGHDYVDGICSRCEKEEPVIHLNENLSVNIEVGGYTELIKFIPEVSGTYYFYSDATNDTYGYLYDGDMRLITSNDDGGNNSNFKISYSFESGQVYYLGAKYLSSSKTGSFYVGLFDSYTDGHKLQLVQTVDPTCTTDGYDEYLCELCNKIVKANIVNATGHSYTVETTEPTCLNRGYTEYTCTTCGDAYRDSFIDAIGHSYIAGICENCGDDRNIYLDIEKTAVINSENEYAYFEFTPTESRAYIFSSVGSSDTYGYLYDSDMNELDSNDDGGSNNNFLIRYNCEAGKTYILGCRYYGSNTGSFNVLVEKGINIVSYTPSKPLEFIENTNCSTRNDSDGNEYAYYHKLFNIGDQIVIEDKNGDEVTYIRENSSWSSSDDYTYSDFHDENGNSVCVYLRHGQYTNHWVAGNEYIVTVECCGATTTVPVTIVESPVASISYAPANPIEIIENTNGCWSQDNNDERFYNYYVPGYKTGDVLTVTDKNGNSVDYIFDSYEREFVSEDGDVLDRGYLNAYSDQYSNHWTLGSDNYYIVEYMGATAQIPVTIVENPVASISYAPANPIEIIENTNGCWSQDNNDERFYNYYVPGYKTGDVLTVTDKNGNSVDYIFDSYEREFVSEDGDVLDRGYLNAYSNQYSNHWTLGSDNYYIVEYMGATAQIPVTIVENPVASISYAPANPIEIFENTNGRWSYDNNDESFYNYYVPDYKTGDVLTVTDKNGNFVDYIFDSYEREFVSEDGDVLDWDYLHPSDNQYSNHWTLGSDNYYTVEYMGATAQVPVTIVENPVESVEYIMEKPYEIIENTNGYWRYDNDDIRYYHYNYSPYVNGASIIVHYKDGTEKTYYCNGNSFVDEDDNYIDLNGWSDYPQWQGYEHWTAGNSYQYKFEVFGYECFGNITIVESPVASISFTPANPIEIIENTNGYWEYNEETGEEFYYYETPWYNYGDVLTVTDKDGNSIDYTYGYNEDLDDGWFLSENGDVIYTDNLDIHSNQYSTPWTMGSDNYYTVEYMGATAQVNVSIVRCEHKYLAEIHQPTCINDGYTHYYCDNCGDSYDTDYITATGVHTYANGFCKYCHTRDENYTFPTISLGETKAVNIENGGDCYYFTFTPQSSGNFIFSSNCNRDTYGYLYDSDMNEIASDDDGGDDTNFSIRYDFEAGITYIFGCKYYSSSNTGSFDVSLIENRVAGISYTPANPIEIIENTNGYWDYNEETDEEFYYYETPCYNYGDVLTVTDKDGNSIDYTYGYNEDLDDRCFLSENADVIYTDNLDRHSNQYSTPWTMGSDNYYTVEYMGATAQVPVAIVESPVASISYTPANPIEIIVNTNGYWDYNEETGEKFYYYETPCYNYGDVLTVTDKDGNSVDYIYDNEECEFVSEDGDVLDRDYLNDYSDQYSNNWALGSENYYTMEYMGATVQVPVAIVENPIASIEYNSIDGFNDIEGITYGYADGGTSHFRDGYVQNGDTLVLNYKNGTVEEYEAVIDDNGFYHFVTADGNELNANADFNINYQYDEDYENVISVNVSCYGYKLNFPIVSSVYISSITFEPVKPVTIIESNGREKDRNTWINDEGNVYYSTFVYWTQDENGEVLIKSEIFNLGDVINVTFSNGKTAKYTYKANRSYESGYCFMGDDNSILYVGNIRSNQNEHPWIVGGDNYFTINFSQASTDKIPVTIVPASEHIHSYSTVVTEPTADTRGYTTYICECGDSYIDDYTDYASDNSVLLAVFEQIESYSSSDFSASTFEDLRSIYDSLSSMATGSYAQTEIDKAVFDLLTAITALEPYLNLNISAPNGAFTVTYNGETNSNNGNSLLFGTNVTLTATANEGYEFVGWYDTINNLYFSKNAEYSFKLTTNTSLKAVFVKEQSATLTFTTYSNWVQSTVTKTIDEWNAVTSIDELLPVVPYRYGYTNGRWVYDNAEVLAKLQTGEDVYLIPEYDEDDTSLPTPPSPDGDTPVLDLYYNLDAEANVGSFVMAAGIPENCQLESVGILFYYKNADEFDPTKFELLINNKMLAGRFNTDEADDIYIINMNKMSAYKNWAARGYVTYYDAEGNLKTVYSNQVNIVNREQV